MPTSPPIVPTNGYRDADQDVQPYSKTPSDLRLVWLGGCVVARRVGGFLRKHVRSVIGWTLIYGSVLFSFSGHGIMFSLCITVGFIIVFSPFRALRNLGAESIGIEPEDP